MSINTCHADQGVVLFNGEWLLIYYDGCELHVDGSGGRSSALHGNKKGRVYLTSHRVLFHNRDCKDRFQSLSMPFVSMRKVEIEQPVFGANYIKGQVVAEPDGGLEGTASFKLWFNNGGAIEFGRAMLTAASQTSRNASCYRPLVTVTEVYSTNYYPAAPPAYMPPPPAYNAYYSTWVPTNTFSAQPPPGSIYMYSAPPPYPGVNGTAPPAPQPMPQPQMPPMNGAQAKAAEAGYYEPPPSYEPR